MEREISSNNSEETLTNKTDSFSSQSLLSAFIIDRLDKQDEERKKKLNNE